MEPIFVGMSPAGVEWNVYPTGDAEKDAAKVEGQIRTLARLWARYSKTVVTLGGFSHNQASLIADVFPEDTVTNTASTVTGSREDLLMAADELEDLARTSDFSEWVAQNSMKDLTDAQIEFGAGSVKLSHVMAAHKVHEAITKGA